ncbi:hypothetical protein [Bradyrhizobium sp.]|uniref:hypothetical protein n=1 Tax=Bradyrhizobium sp. TaxID=376 RepID=UPI003C4CC464
MMFVIEILDKPDQRGNARVIERRTHTGATVAEALRTAQANLRMPPASAYSFSMRAEGKEVGRWRRFGDGQISDILGDIEAAQGDDD